MSRTNRNWPQGIRPCSKCGKPFKQLSSLAAHSRVCPGKKTKARDRYPEHFKRVLDKRSGLDVFHGRPSVLKLARRLLDDHGVAMTAIEPYRRGYAQRADLVHAWAGRGSDGRQYASTDTVAACVKASALRIRPPSKGSMEEAWALTYVDAIP